MWAWFEYLYAFLNVMTDAPLSEVGCVEAISAMRRLSPLRS